MVVVGRGLRQDGEEGIGIAIVILVSRRGLLVSRKGPRQDGEEAATTTYYLLASYVLLYFLCYSYATTSTYLLGAPRLPWLGIK